MRKIIKWLVCSILLICCSLLVDVSTKITASAQESEVVEEIEPTSNDTETICFMGKVEFVNTSVSNNTSFPSLAGNLIYIYKQIYHLYLFSLLLKILYLLILLFLFQ